MKKQACKINSYKRQAFNRTKLECKVSNGKEKRICDLPFNRTKLECKEWYVHNDTRDTKHLIELN